ncbi:MAG: maltose alpha-D-glucosyltransferase [Thiohalocapsa sp.]|nr:maltose alpha-D-glucosyltransferase [Thiohalocapsa sp.]
MQPSTQPNTPESDPLWYKDAIIYQTHVKAFFDTDGDGVGDFRGLTQKLDYVRELGVNTLWILPFYPSPMRDDGYDISDYRNIHSAYGTRRDFRRFVGAAHRRGLRVIVELVVNHTSDQHPWFQAARRAPRGSSKRNFYVWSDDDSRFSETRIIFTDSEASNWTWDPEAEQYYWHRFFSHQPDLNHNNPQVVKAMIRVMRFWLDLGVDGLRLDAIPYLCVREGTSNENLPETHAVIKRMRAVVDAHYENRMFLAEANQWPEDVRDYFGDGDECHMAYHFPLMPRMYMALAQEERHPIVEILEQTPEIPANCQWAIFLRNHDELTLEMVSDRERDYMYRTYAADPRMRVNVGIRRRLAPLLGNDQDKIRLMVSLLLSMPGSPILYYGDELGMGDNIYLGDRNGVRTPMQWSPDRNAGFSRADPEQLYLPPIMDPIYGYQSVNVEAQARTPSSLLNWMRRIIEVRKAHRVFGRGTMELLHPGNRKILAYVRRYGGEGAPQAVSSVSAPAEDAPEDAGEAVLCVANLGRGAQPVELDLSRFNGRVPIELMGQTSFPPIGELPYLLTLPGHGFYWFLLSEDADAPAWHDERVAAPRLATLVLPEGWLSLQPDLAERRQTALRAVALLQSRVLPAYLTGRCGRCATDGRETRQQAQVQRVTIEAARIWDEWMLTLVRVELAEAPAERLLLPLALTWQTPDAALPTVPAAATTLAQARMQATPGLMHEALADTSFVQALVRATGEGGELLALGDGRLSAHPTRAFGALAGDCLDAPTHLLPEDPDNGVVLGERLLLKTLRCPAARGGEGGAPGAPDPLIETARLLTDDVPFDGIPALAGHLDYRFADGAVCTLAVVERFVPNQGDLQTFIREHLERLYDEFFFSRPDDDWRLDPGQISLDALIDALGRRTAELHLALTRGGEAFRPEPVTDDEAAAWRADMMRTAARTLDRLHRERDALPEAARSEADRLLAHDSGLESHFAEATALGFGPAKLRLHGDLSLARVLVAEHDVVLTGAGGPLDVPRESRRLKRPPLADVGGLIYSLHETVERVLLAMAQEHPHPRERLQEPLANWRRGAVQRLMSAYNDAAAGAAIGASPEHAWLLARLYALTSAVDGLALALQRRPERRAAAVATLLSLL